MAQGRKFNDTQTLGSYQFLKKRNVYIHLCGYGCWEVPMGLKFWKKEKKEEKKEEEKKEAKPEEKKQ